jgi:hypothetical protein
LLTERKHIALLGAVAALAAPAAASAAQNEKLPPRVRLRADSPRAASGGGAVTAPKGSAAGTSIGIGNAKALTGPLLDPVDRYSELIVRRTVKAEHVHEVHARKRREAREEQERFENLPGGVSMATLEAIASCESGGDPEAVSADGSYMGLYQFDQGTWESVGGTGSPTEASAAEQTYRAALLYSESGSSPWPICGQ